MKSMKRLLSDAVARFKPVLAFTLATVTPAIQKKSTSPARVDHDDHDGGSVN